MWAATGDRSRAVDTMTSLWGDLGPAAAGLDVEVRGAQHLEAARPAVFLFNHQSQVDAMLVCALLRRNFVGIAKQEIRSHPVMGPAMTFAGTVFIDRSNREQAVAALQPAVETLRRGTSIAIFPEGTRGEKGELGPFKKGAFRIALAAGAPLVPVVIRNAWERMPRGAYVASAGPIEVEVLAPIDTADWTLDGLDGHIEQVRRTFADALEG